LKEEKKTEKHTHIPKNNKIKPISTKKTDKAIKLNMQEQIQNIKTTLNKKQLSFM